MAQLKSLIVNGASRFIGDTFLNQGLTSGGDLMPNADNTLSVGSASLRWKFYGTLTGSLSKTWKVKLNHDSTQKTYNGSADTDLGTIYAPTSSGTAGYILKSGGANTAPSWIQIVPTANGGTGNSSFTKDKLIYAETATKLSSYSSTKGGVKKLWYLNAGVPTDSSETVGSSSQPVYMNAGTITQISSIAMPQSAYWSEGITTAGVGWYIVATYNSASSTTRGNLEFYIDSTGGSMSPSMCKVLLELTWSVAAINRALFVGSNYLVGGVRLTKDSSKTYVEIYFNRAAASGARLMVPYNSPYYNVNQSYSWGSEALTASVSGATVGTTYWHPQGGISTDNISPIADLSYNIGTNTKRFNNVFTNCLELSGPASNPSATAGGRIKFSYDASANTGGSQPVYLAYTPNDSYRAPAGLKIMGDGTSGSSSPAWLEVEGNIYAAAFKGKADTASAISPAGTTEQFWRGDNSWSNTLGISTVDNTAFKNTLILENNRSTESSYATLDETKPSFGLGFNFKWSSGNVGNMAGIYGVGLGSYRAGLAFRIKKTAGSSTTPGKHDQTVAWMSGDGIVVKGKLLINPSYSTLTNSYNEGLRLNRASNGWSVIELGGAADTVSGNGLGTWLIGAKATPADATTAAASITNSHFYVSYNGSDGAACRIQGHNATGFSIRPKLYINTDVPASGTVYNLYVNGTSYINGQTYVKTLSGLEGGHVVLFCKNSIVSTSTPKVGTTTNLTTSDSDAEWLKATLKAICSTYPNYSSVVFRGKISPNSEGYYEVCIYSTNDVDSNGLPRYSYGTFRKYSDAYWVFGTSSFSYYCTAIVKNSGTWGISITGNAATATALTSNAGGARNPIYFSDGKPVAGEVTFDTLNANRLVWTSAANKPYAGYHYASSTQVGICATSVTSGIAFEVDGKAHITSTASNSLTDTPPAFTIGTLTGTHLGVARAGIQAKSNATTASTLNLNYYGGGVQIGSSSYNSNTTSFGSINPGVDNTFNLGSASLRWKNLYISGATRRTSRIYPYIASNERSQWYKITFPYSTVSNSSNNWFMLSFDLHFGGGYSSNATGVGHIAFYYQKNTSNVWTLSQGSAKLDGILMNKITFYYRTAEPGILYVNNSSNNYNGIWMDNLFCDDTAPSYDWTTTKIETCSAITDSTSPALSAYTVLPTVRTYAGTDATYYIGNNTLPNSNNSYSLGGSSNAWSYVYSNGVTVNNANKNNAGGLSLYSTTPTDYGIAMRSGGAHGWITAAQSNANIAAAQGISTSDLTGTDWAINFYNSGSKLRGFKFMHGGSSVASINGYGYAQVNRLGLNRAGSATYGRIYWYSPAYYTWVDYMSNSAAGAAPNGGQPATLGDVTNWAKRSLIENVAGYGWVWEAAANSVIATSANTTKPTALMALNSNNGNLFLNGDMFISSTSGETDRSLVFGYQNNTTLTTNNGASWRIVHKASGSSDTNYFAIESSKSTAGNSKAWNNVLRAGMDTFNILLGSSTDVSAGNGTATAAALEVSGGIQTIKSIKIGKWTNTSTAPGYGIRVHDLRDIAENANKFGDQSVNWYFKQINGNWASIMSIKGWTGSYYAWELAGNAHNSSIDRYYVRTLTGTTAGTWHTLAYLPAFAAIGGTDQPVYVNANGAVTATSYYLKSNISAGTANQVAYYSDATTIASKAPAWEDWTAGTTAGPKANIQIGNATYASPVIPSASTSASGIVTTGDQRFKGTKGFGYLTLYGDEAGTAKQYDTIRLYNNAGTQVGALFYDFGNTTNISSGQWNFRQYSPNATASTTTTGKFETFKLPVVTSGLADNVIYDILTTKNPPVIWIKTAAGTAAKVGTTAYYTLANNRYLHVILTTTSTVKSALTLNINGAGAKPIYLNGSATSSSNYSIPAGHYQVYYDGTNYYFNTNEYLPVGSIAPGPTNVNVVGNSSHYFRGAYINGFGNIHWGNLYAVNVGGNTDPVITADRLRGLNRVVAGGGADYYRPTNALFGVRNSSVTIEITTDGGSTWTTKTGLDTRNFFNENTMTITPGLNAAGTAFDQYDATNANSTTGGGSGVTYAAGFWANKGIRITIDMLPEGRTGTLDMLILRFGTAGSSSTNKSHYKIERLNYTKDLNTPTDWVTIHESASTSWNSNDRLQTIYPPQFYLSGTSSSSTASYARYLRITFIVDDWATAYRYAPRLIAFAGFTSAGALNTANARTGSEFARAMVTFGGPYIIEDRNTGALGFDSDLLPRSRTTEGSAIVTNNVHNIGASNRRWATVYATTFDGAATQVKATSSNTKAYILGGSSYSGNVTVYSNSNVYMQSGVLYGAAWNDYAEFRQSKDNIPIEPGRVVKELGDDTLELANARLQRGCEIVSDTYGFAIGQTEKANLPIATTGRVLAYPYESLNDFKECIGWAVCSGPNGTVSIMTEDEERNYPSRIIGYISAVPDYEIWHGEKEIEVNGRVWIRVR